jgi:hypothetical protein
MQVANQDAWSGSPEERVWAFYPYVANGLPSYAVLSADLSYVFWSAPAIAI